MATYKVVVKITQVNVIEVEAENERHAKYLAIIGQDGSGGFIDWSDGEVDDTEIVSVERLKPNERSTNTK